MSKPTIRGMWLEIMLDASMAGKTIEEILKDDLAFSGRSIQRLTRQNGIMLNRKAPFLKKKGREGDLLRVLIGDREKGKLIPEEIPIDVCYEDDEVLVVNKQPGLMVHPVKPDQSGTLANGIAHYWAKKGTIGKVRPVHRLDKDTSGLILIAKNSYIHQLLDRQLREKRIDREYVAVVSGHLNEKEGRIHEPIAPDPNHPIKRKVDPRGEEAITHYQVKEEFPGASLVHVRLETGRTHQIRVHFAHIGHGILGDKLYGEPHPHIQRQALHAWRLSFQHPIRKHKLEFEQPMPHDMQHLIESLVK